MAFILKFFAKNSSTARKQPTTQIVLPKKDYVFAKGDLLYNEKSTYYAYDHITKVKQILFHLTQVFTASQHQDDGPDEVMNYGYQSQPNH